MAKYVFPAVFSPEKKGYSVNFPDVDGCYTSGNDLADSMEMAQDVLCLMLYCLEERRKDIPKATKLDKVKHKTNEVVTLIECDTEFYKLYFENKSVRRTVTIPEWLNNMARKQNVDFSAVLQKGLKEHLGITERRFFTNQKADEYRAEQLEKAL